MNNNISLKPKDFIQHEDIWEDIFKNLKLSYEPYGGRGGELFEFQMGTVTGFGRQI